MDPLPEGADPMDIRYNIIQWVHRYTRGWSYGDALADPRTGEIIKGNVTLGSLRGRQDYLIAEGLLAPYKAGQMPKPGDNPMLQMVLARIRQLAAHETGHTLGLAHNFAASSISQSRQRHGLSASLRDAGYGWNDRYVACIRRPYRRLGQGCDRLWLPAVRPEAPMWMRRSERF